MSCTHKSLFGPIDTIDLEFKASLGDVMCEYQCWDENALKAARTGCGGVKSTSSHFALLDSSALTSYFYLVLAA